MKKKEVLLVNRDVSWLSFNARVLQEADDNTVPLFERLRFLGIYSNNLDEFFKIRVATIRRMKKFGKRGKKIIGTDPSSLLEKIQEIVVTQQKKFDSLFASIKQELESENIFQLSDKQLNPVQELFVRDYFHQSVYPNLVPIMIDTAPHFPYLKDRMIYLAVKFRTSNQSGKKNKFALIEVPTDVLPRVIVLPSTTERKDFILLEDIIRFCLNDIFSIFDYETIEGYTIKMTRDAELDIESDISKSWIEKVSKSVKQRKKGDIVRLVFDDRIPADLLDFIVKKIKLKDKDYLISGGKYHNFKDFISFPRIGRKELWYKIPKPIKHVELAGQKSMFTVIRAKDILLAYPYHSYLHIIDLLREASIDPKVTSIKITLYRVSTNSGIINALINALRNGKQVTAVVELQARFDEETNIYYADKLQEAGADVIFGVQGLKVHSKLFLITRIENDKTIHYGHIGTGNFNEKTAKLYCDHTLLTADKSITREVERLFSFYQDNYKTGHYKHLVVSPFNTRKKFLSLFNQEIENALTGKDAWMILKMNSLVDTEFIEKLYEASNAGVKIQLIIRGICSLVPGVQGLSENIEAISIVDKFLEHSRIFIFCHDNNEKYFISSGDWMNRNLDFRTEVAVPIYDTQLQAQLLEYVMIQLRDNTKARLLSQGKINDYKVRIGKPINAQDEIYRWVQSLNVASRKVTKPVLRTIAKKPLKKATRPTIKKTASKKSPVKKTIKKTVINNSTLKQKRKSKLQ